jgi:cytochrome c
MRWSVAVSGVLMLVAGGLGGPAWAAEGDATKGAALFRVCAACHSLEPGRHLTGPSLASIWKRKAGSVSDFLRYSVAMKASGVVWDERTLDAWLKDPQGLVPGNEMTFPGIPRAGERQELIAFLKAASQGTLASSAQQPAPNPRRNLKEAPPADRVTAIRYCKDTYWVTTAAGKTRTFWEFNLRFKTDSSPDGPTKGAPVLLAASMQGDRAFVIFAGPEELGATIRRKCE